ncbi:flexible cuticle protein 12-like [Chrysoperla carnea]|uniref:flexible cuticle protein 12-like n=1 Tax=Chrysoperla carnea TaxID=189513 RepID=UPI001D06F5FA|nr:flexible cuticle protein 12-like [Chrysoperla carnea]
MKFVIVLVALVACALAKPVEDKNVEVVRYDNDNIGVGGYDVNVELSDGQARSEHAEVVNAGTDEQFLRVTGQFKYFFDGVEYLVKYYADDTGFHAEGAHLPKEQ